MRAQTAQTVLCKQPTIQKQAEWQMRDAYAAACLHRATASQRGEMIPVFLAKPPASKAFHFVSLKCTSSASGCLLLWVLGHSTYAGKATVEEPGLGEACPTHFKRITIMREKPLLHCLFPSSGCYSKWFQDLLIFFEQNSVNKPMQS